MQIDQNVNGLGLVETIHSKHGGVTAFAWSTRTNIYLYLHQQFSDTEFIPFSNGMAIQLPDQNQGKEINTNPGTWHRRIENSRNICKDPDLTEKKINREKEDLGSPTHRFQWYASTFTEVAYKGSCNL